MINDNEQLIDLDFQNLEEEDEIEDDILSKRSNVTITIIDSGIEMDKEETIQNPFIQAYQFFLADICRLLSIRETIQSLE